MKRGPNQISVTELSRDDQLLPKLDSRYSTSSYYDLTITQEPQGWKIELTTKLLGEPLEKRYTGTLFEAHIEEPRVFCATIDGERVGWVELGYEKWNNRMRVWEFLVDEKSRRMGVGTQLMDHAVKVAKDRGARMLVLETQSCNIPAIAFYIKQGFRLIGFDSHAYSNEDAMRREVRLEFGLPL